MKNRSIWVDFYLFLLYLPVLICGDSQSLETDLALDQRSNLLNQITKFKQLLRLWNIGKSQILLKNFKKPYFHPIWGVRAMPPGRSPDSGRLPYLVEVEPEPPERRIWTASGCKSASCSKQEGHVDPRWSERI